MTFDPVVEHEKTRAALRAAAARLVRLLREAPDLHAASGLPAWTVGDVGAHLASVFLAYGAGFTDDAVEWGHVLPPQEGTLTERIAALNAHSVGLVTGAERARIGDVVAERGETFLRATEGLDPETLVATPWYGPQRTVTLAAATAMVLSESLVHGLDIARGAGLPWRIGPDEACLVLGQAMPTMMRLALDPEKARGVSMAFDLAVKGGPRLAIVVADGTVTVTRDAPPRVYDCRLTVSPTAFLLVSFRRTPMWQAIARGRMRAGGRRPWRALRLAGLLANP
ncbi:maleylpyruvate isomerase N-terminal domain-containing protein [Streptomyces sp. NPDC051561]|uniref:maleylpyruvate isomerase N-terminal domain-containing protein n=1 Tax=Streptomyces sp. NPDC051561 TaxID=3365658 RepID=UPI0037A58311